MAGLSERGVYADQDGKVAPIGKRRETCWRGISSGHIRAEDRVELFRWREMTALGLSKSLPPLHSMLNPSDARPSLLLTPRLPKTKMTKPPFGGLSQYLKHQENLERAKGLEPSTPTLARIGDTSSHLMPLTVFLRAAGEALGRHWVEATGSRPDYIAHAVSQFFICGYAVVTRLRACQRTSRASRGFLVKSVVCWCRKTGLEPVTPSLRMT